MGHHHWLPCPSASLQSDNMYVALAMAQAGAEVAEDALQHLLLKPQLSAAGVQAVLIGYALTHSVDTTVQMLKAAPDAFVGHVTPEMLKAVVDSWGHMQVCASSSSLLACDRNAPTPQRALCTN